FRSHQNALNFASHGAERLNRILAADNLVHVVERYCKGDIEIRVPLEGSVGEARKFHLVLVAVPARCLELKASVSDCEVSAQSYAATTDHHRVKHLVLGRITKL